MAKICTKCGLEIEDDAKFCPGCGETAEADPVETAQQPPVQTPTETLMTVEPINEPKPVAEDPAQEPEKKRIFHLRERKYGDTAQFVGETDTKKDAPEPQSTPKANVSIYLSVFALVLSIIAITMVIIFAVMPAEKSNGDSEKEVIVETLPTMEPTEPPIKGTFVLQKIEGGSGGFIRLLLQDSELEMDSDYSGKLVVRGAEISDIQLDTDSHTMNYLNTECNYSFDGSKITVEFREMTLVYQKAD